jgi:transglutaminase-like putative cysteine protease
MSGAVRYLIEHVTRYEHGDLVSMSHHLACLRPRDLEGQWLESFELTVDPPPAHETSRVDAFGNVVTHFELLVPYRMLQAVSRSVVRVEPSGSIDPSASPPWEDVRDMGVGAAGLAVDVAQFRVGSPCAGTAPELADFARQAFTAGRPLLAAAVDLMHMIHRECRFDPGATSVTTPVTRVLTDRHGVCQDFAHLQVASMRSLGLPARYVSGYLLTDPPPGQPRLVGADASHAWVSVWCPLHGWVDLDPTNDLRPDVRHITIGWGRDYGDVSPLRGVIVGGVRHALYVGVNVAPVQ